MRRGAAHIGGEHLGNVRGRVRPHRRPRLHIKGAEARETDGARDPPPPAPAVAQVFIRHNIAGLNLRRGAEVCRLLRRRRCAPAPIVAVAFLHGLATHCFFFFARICATFLPALRRIN